MSSFLAARLCSVSRVLRYVSAGFTNVSGLAVGAFDLVYYSLSVLWFVFVSDFCLFFACRVSTRLRSQVLHLGINR